MTFRLNHVNKKTGVTYVYESVSYWDKAKKQSRNKQVCVGKLDPVTGEFISSKRLTSKTVKARDSAVTASTEIVGPLIVLDNITKQLGLGKLLKLSFPKHHQQILMMAYYLTFKGEALSHCELWCKSHAPELAESLTSQRISEILESINVDAKQTFLSRWMNKILEDDYLCYDITSISSYKGNRKTQEGSSHPDRNAQFMHIHETSSAFQKRGDPVISIDTKKKEILGNHKNGGKEWAPKGMPQQVKVHDFIDKKLGKVIPYGIYDIGQNKGFVSVGVDHDTAEFAVATIRRWWNGVGRVSYAGASQLYITADGGGSNASRSRLFKLELQKLADEINLAITVSHYPPGTSKWNKIEHRMFCHITANWRAVPLETREIVVELISHTTTSKGLAIQAELDTNTYEKGRSVTKKEFEGLALTRKDFHGDWNYTIAPRHI